MSSPQAYVPSENEYCLFFHYRDIVGEEGIKQAKKWFRTLEWSKQKNLLDGYGAIRESVSPVIGEALDQAEEEYRWGEKPPHRDDVVESFLLNSPPNLLRGVVEGDVSADQLVESIAFVDEDEGEVFLEDEYHQRVPLLDPEQFLETSIHEEELELQGF